MMYMSDFKKVIADTKFNGWTFDVKYDLVGGGRDGKCEYPSTRCYLQIRAIGDDNVTGGRTVWKGRKWFLSPHMTRSEIVNTVFKAVLTAVEHEAREQFLYRGRSIFDPHYDVDQLWLLCGDIGALSEREEV